MSHNVSFRWFFGVVAAARILVITTAGAQPPPVSAPVAAAPLAAVSTNVQDYSQGFRAFISIGLPDTSQAKYVTLVFYGGGMFDMSSYRLREAQLSGNAWLVSENTDGRSVLVSSQGRTLELYDQKTQAKKLEAAARSNALAQAAAPGQGGGKRGVVSLLSQRGVDRSQSGSWTPADLSRDVAKATSFVEKKLKAKVSGDNESRYDSFFESDEASSMLFLFATFAWQNGKVQEANALAGGLFKLAGDARKVIVGALNVVADAQLAATAEAFQSSHDWKAYHEAVSGLLKKYPAGWRKAGAAKLLAERLQARAALTEPPAVTGDGLAEEDQTLAAALASEFSQDGASYGGSGGLWILQPPEAVAGVRGSNVLERIKARGVKSVPLLIALLPDVTMCPLPRNELCGTSYYSSRDTEKSEAERAQATFDRMDDRPLTRGEIARELLKPLRASEEEDLDFSEYEASPEEVAAAAKQAYAKVKDLSPSAMAQHFLKSGSERQKLHAISFMLQFDVEANVPVIEAYLLTPPEEGVESMMRSDTGLARQYVEKRGEKAAGFVEKFAALRKKIEVSDGLEDDAKYVKRMEQQREGEIKALRALVKPQDLSETVASLAAPKVSREALEPAYTALRRQPAARTVPLLLAAAVQTTNVAARARLLRIMPVLRFSGLQELAQRADTEEAMEAMMLGVAEKNKLNVGTNAAAWKLLLSDSRFTQGGQRRFEEDDKMTVSDLAAAAIEALFGTQASMRLMGCGREDGAENLPQGVVRRVNRERAAARLEGTAEDKLSKLPSADDVAENRRQALEAEVLKAAPAALAPLLGKLTDAESLYLAQAAEEKEPLMKALVPSSRLIVSVKTDAALPAEEAARLRKLEGTTVSTNAIAEMREVCKRQLARGAVCTVSLSSAGLGKGLSLAVTAPDATASRENRYPGYLSALNNKGGKPKGVVTGTLICNEGYYQGMWLVELPASFAPTGTVGAAAAKGEDFDEDQAEMYQNHFETQQEAYEAAVETFCASDHALGLRNFVTFAGCLPPKARDKTKAAGEDDEDDEDADAGYGDPFGF